MFIAMKTQNLKFYLWNSLKKQEDILKILTTVKKVVDVELTIHVEDGAIVEDGLQYVMNAWDENAVEATVQLKENSNAETTLVSIGGGEENTKIIRKGFAMGIENGIQIDDPALDKADASDLCQSTAKGL